MDEEDPEIDKVLSASSAANGLRSVDIGEMRDAILNVAGESFGDAFVAYQKSKFVLDVVKDLDARAQTALQPVLGPFQKMMEKMFDKLDLAVGQFVMEKEVMTSTYSAIRAFKDEHTLNILGVVVQAANLAHAAKLFLAAVSPKSVADGTTAPFEIGKDTVKLCIETRHHLKVMVDGLAAVPKQSKLDSGKYLSFAFKVTEVVKSITSQAEDALRLAQSTWTDAADAIAQSVIDKAPSWQSFQDTMLSNVEMQQTLLSCAHFPSLKSGSETLTEAHRDMKQINNSGHGIMFSGASMKKYLGAKNLAVDTVGMAFLLLSWNEDISKEPNLNQRINKIDDLRVSLEKRDCYIPTDFQEQLAIAGTKDFEPTPVVSGSSELRGPLKPVSKQRAKPLRQRPPLTAPG
jgi:hypothetical protein